MIFKEKRLDYIGRDVKYIIVPDEPALNQIIDVIKELKLEESIKYLLISKIEISSRFSEDLT